MGYIYHENTKLIHDYPEEPNLKWNKAVIIPGQRVAQVNAAAMSKDEVDQILQKLDFMAHQANNESIARMLVSEADSVLALVRIVKKEIGGAGVFAGIQGAGQQLDICWVRPRHIGGALVNKAVAANKAVWGQALVGTYGQPVWAYSTFTAGTALDFVPSQQMDDYAGMLHIGFIDPVINPHVDAFTATLSGRTTSAQTLKWNVRKAFDESVMPVAKIEMPILAMPKATQTISVMPTITNGDSKLELLSILCGKAESLAL